MITLKCPQDDCNYVDDYIFDTECNHNGTYDDFYCSHCGRPMRVMVEIFVVHL